MNLFKYAAKNLKLYKYRSIIMTITMILVITASVIGVSIQKATKGISDQYREKLGVEVNIDVDSKKVMKGGYAPKAITQEQYEKISNIESVKSFSYLTEIMVGSKKLKADGEDQQKGEDKMAIVGSEGKKLNTPKFKLIGGGGNADLPEFKKGTRSLLEGGRAPQNDYEAIMSEELAKLNNLKVGDKFSLHDASQKKEQEYTLTGIYEDNTIKDGGTGVDMPVFNRRNEIITNFPSAKSIDDEGMAQVRATYELNHPNDFDSFKQQVRDLGVREEEYTISIDEESFNKAVGPINNINKTVSYFIVIILMIAAGILTLLSILSVRERQYEIGVLRAMGMKKLKLGAGFMLESCMVLGLALVIGVMIGGTVTKPIANSLLKEQVTAMEAERAADEEKSITSLFGPNRSNEIETVDTIDVKIDYRVILNIAGIGLVIILLTNLINIVYIMKFQPIEIMRKKN